MTTNDLLKTDRGKVIAAFGKTEKDLAKDVNIIKNWLKSQPHLPEIPSDHMIESFLVTNKFSIEATKPKLDMYYTIRSLIPEIYENKHPRLPHMQKVFETSLCCPLPKQTKEMYRVYVMKVIAEPEEYDTYDYMAHQISIFEVRIQEDLALGDVFIIDYEHFKMGHVRKTTLMHIKKSATILEKVFSNRAKSIHLINCPTYVDILMNIGKVVLKPKIFSRIHIHNNLEEIYEYIPKEILPVDYGGEEKSLRELNDAWKLKIEEYYDRFDKLDKMRVNEEVRPEALKNDDILGFHGNFKKLDVD